MSIRSGAKALIIKDGKILMNRCAHEDGTVYYDLPGGGQHKYEPLEDAVIREVREETGYPCRIVRFCALAEEIFTSPAIREKYPDYTHRMLHIFLVEITGEKENPAELDWGMTGSKWLTFEELRAEKKVYPPSLPGKLDEILEGENALWLGTAWSERTL